MIFWFILKHILRFSLNQSLSDPRLRICLGEIRSGILLMQGQRDIRLRQPLNAGYLDPSFSLFNPEGGFLLKFFKRQGGSEPCCHVIHHR